jgi:hypothetical protein
MVGLQTKRGVGVVRACLPPLASAVVRIRDTQ